MLVAGALTTVCLVARLVALAALALLLAPSDLLARLGLFPCLRRGDLGKEGADARQAEEEEQRRAAGRPLACGEGGVQSRVGGDEGLCVASVFTSGASACEAGSGGVGNEEDKEGRGGPSSRPACQLPRVASHLCGANSSCTEVAGAERRSTPRGSPTPTCPPPSRPFLPCRGRPAPCRARNNQLTRNSAQVV